MINSKSCGTAGIFIILAAVFSIGAAVVTPTLELKSDADGLLLTNKLKSGDWSTAALKLTLHEGKEQKNLPFTTRITDAADSVKVSATGAGWVWATEFQRRGVLVYGESTFTNNCDRELWIEPGLNAAIEFSSVPKYFWDGFGKVRNLNSKPLERRGIKGLVLEHVGSKELPFPATAVFGSNGGLQLGHVIFDPVSYSATFYHPGKHELRFTQRFAVQAGETVKFGWIVGSFPASFGGPEAAIQQHYDAFPERWAVSGGQDNPYIWGNNSQYSNWWYTPDPELSRRFKQSCEWAYVPYKRAGDIACREDLWDYLPNNPFVKNPRLIGGQRIDIEKISREKFLDTRREIFRKYGKRFGWMFYNNCAGTWYEIDLAKTRYPDAINDTDPSSNHLIKGWSTRHDWEIRVFPMGTSLAKVFEEDMKNLTEELNLPGFALDCGSGGVSYRGPAVKQRLPGRAWDEQGVFIDQSVAVNHVVDYIHSLRPDMTVFINGPLKGDLVMFERAFVRTEELEKMMPLYKWYIGPRPSVNHGHGYMFTDMVANWRSLSTEEFKETVEKLGVYQLFSQFKYGMSGSYITMCGVPDLVYALPEFFELRRAGWRALNPMELSDSLYAPYRSSFGGGADSFLFFGNSRSTDSSGTVAVDNDLLTAYSGEKLVFVRKLRSRASLVNRISGRLTSFNAVFPARVPVLYETVCAIGGAPENLTVESRSEKNLEREIYTAELKETPDFTGTLKIRPIRGFSSTLTLNGKPVRQGTPLKMKAGDVIVAEYVSTLFKLPQSAIDSFPFTDDKQKISCRLWFDAKDTGAGAAADRFVRFFDFLRDKRLLHKDAALEIVHAPELRGAAGTISLESRAGEAQIMLTPAGGLLLTASSSEELEQVSEKLLDRMDRRYPYVFPFKGVAGMPLEVLKHFKMLGKSLPARNFFE